MLMEVTLASLWYQGALPSIPISWPGIFTVLGAILFASSWLRRGISLSRLEAIRQVLLLAWLFLVFAVSLVGIALAGLDIDLVELLRRPESLLTHAGIESVLLLHLLSISVIIWRGFSLARSRASSRNIQVSFQLGLILLLIYGMSFSAAHPAEAAVGLYLYLFLALVSMSAARVASLGGERSGRVPLFRAGWFASVILAALGFVGLAVLAGWFFSQRVIAWIVQGIALLLSILSAALLVMLNPLFTFLAQFVSRVIETIRRLAGQIGSIRLPKIFEDLAGQAGDVLERMFPGDSGPRLMLLILALGLIAATLLLAGKYRAYRRLAGEEDSGQVDSSKVPGAFQRMLQRLFPANVNLRLRRPGQIFAAARIRFIYRQLIARARKLGVERPPSATPLEFIPALAVVFDHHEEHIEAITSAYVHVRYGEYPETMREVETVQRAWDAIRRRK